MNQKNFGARKGIARTIAWYALPKFGLSTRGILVWMTIHDAVFPNSPPSVGLSVEQIAARTALSESSVHRALRELKSKKVLTIKSGGQWTGKNGDRRRVRNQYQTLLGPGGQWWDSKALPMSKLKSWQEQSWKKQN